MEFVHVPSVCLSIFRKYTFEYAESEKNPCPVRVTDGTGIFVYTNRVNFNLLDDTLSCISRFQHRQALLFPE